MTDLDLGANWKDYQLRLMRTRLLIEVCLGLCEKDYHFKVYAEKITKWRFA